MAEFNAELDKLDLSESQAIDLAIVWPDLLDTASAGRTTVLRITIGGATQPPGGISGTSHLSNVLAPTLKSHITEKGRHAITYDVNFLVAYVRLPGRGSADIKTSVIFGDAVAKAVKLNESPATHWLGSQLIHSEGSDDASRFFANPRAVYPAELSPELLAEAIGATLTPLPRFVEDISG